MAPSNGWGGPRPGAGRKPRTNGHQANGQRGFSSPPPVTLGQALESLRQAAPPPGANLPLAGVSGSQQPGTSAAPPAGVITPRPDNESFAKLMAYVGTNVGVLVIRDNLKKGGLDPQDPDPEDVERTTDATAGAIARALGDAEIPWWGTLVAAWGSLYLSMRLGARPIPTEQQGATAQASAAAPAAPATVLGQGVPQRPARSGSSSYTVLPEVRAPAQ